MSDQAYDVLPSSPRWTHIALSVDDIDESIAFYTAYTPLELIEKRQDDNGWGAWLGQEGHPDSPFFLVLAQFLPEMDPWPNAPKTVMGPFAHIGIELVSKEDVDERAAIAAEGGHLAHGPVQLPPPIGYVCFVTDPDGNTVEFSYGQGIFAKAQELWGDRR
ncbi:MAG: VOC family protein [Acidimicrobiia bacterium]|nr:VOC family protein [Acidimicrobiia bacterium]